MAEPVLEPVGPSPAPDEVDPPGRPPSSALTAIVAWVVIVAALYFASEVLIPITLAVLLSFVLSPLMELMRRVWIPRVLAALLSVLVAIGIIIALGGIIGTQIAGLVSQAPLYQYTIEQKVNSLQHLIADQLSSRISFITKRLQSMGNLAPQAQPGKEPAENEQPQQPPVPVTITELPANSALQLGERVLGPILHPIATLGIILVVAIFTLLQKQDLRDRLIRLFGSNDLHRATVAMDDAGRRLSRYFLSQLCVNCSFGVIIGFGLFMIGVPSPVLWGIIGALLRFVPYIGVYISAALPVMLAAAVGTGWSMVAWTAILFIVTDTIIGQAVEPHGVRPQHRAFTILRDRRRHFLGMALGAHRPHPLHPPHSLPGGHGAPHRTLGIPGSAARRSPCPDPDRDLLPTPARGRRQRGGGTCAALSQGTFPHGLL